MPNTEWRDSCLYPLLLKYPWHFVDKSTIIPANSSKPSTIYTGFTQNTGYMKHCTQPLQLSKSNMHSCSSIGYLERSMSQATVEVILFQATRIPVRCIQIDVSNVRGHFSYFWQWKGLFWVKSTPFHCPQDHYNYFKGDFGLTISKLHTHNFLEHYTINFKYSYWILGKTLFKSEEIILFLFERWVNWA